MFSLWILYKIAVIIHAYKNFFCCFDYCLYYWLPIFYKGADSTTRAQTAKSPLLFGNGLVCCVFQSAEISTCSAVKNAVGIRFQPFPRFVINGNFTVAVSPCLTVYPASFQPYHVSNVVCGKSRTRKIRLRSFSCANESASFQNAQRVFKKRLSLRLRAILCAQFHALFITRARL